MSINEKGSLKEELVIEIKFNDQFSKWLFGPLAQSEAIQLRDQLKNWNIRAKKQNLNDLTNILVLILRLLDYLITNQNIQDNKKKEVIEIIKEAHMQFDMVVTCECMESLNYSPNEYYRLLELVDNKIGKVNLDNEIENLQSKEKIVLDTKAPRTGEKSSSIWKFISNLFLGNRNKETKRASNPKDIEDAALKGDLSLVKQLIGEGIPLPEGNPKNEPPDGIPYEFWDRDSEGGTILHRLAVSGNAEMIELLIKSGMDSEGVAKRTPLYEAVQHGHSNVVKVLLDNGASSNYFLESTYETPLSNAASKGYKEIVSLLISHGADIKEAHYDQINDQEISLPIHRAARRGYWEVVQILVENGCDPNIETTGAAPAKTALELANDSLKYLCSSDQKPRIFDRTFEEKKHSLEQTIRFLRDYSIE